MTKNLKPGISRAKRLIMASRKPIADIIASERRRYAAIEELIGRHMTRRVDCEETIAELLEIERGLSK